MLSPPHHCHWSLIVTWNPILVNYVGRKIQFCSAIQNISLDSSAVVSIGVPLDEIMSSSCISFAILSILIILIILIIILLIILIIILLIILVVGILVKISVKPEWIMSRPSREERYPRFREIGDSRTHFGKW